ncbi:MAG: hypothetical protein GF331_03350 [Chitinivibrionales bacterium]|nr:hypothetical protein [Chitinivibrionales bacterium]
MTAKEMAQRVISHLPDESTYDDIQYHLYVLQCLEQGEKDIENGRSITHEEVEQRLAQWLK